jgi:small-conductance mechanosensitive channel
MDLPHPMSDTESENPFPMKKRQQAAAIILLAIASVILFGLWKTNERATPNSETEKNSASGQSIVVDQRPLRTAQGLAKLATTPEERPLAQDALKWADREVDLAFASALREARIHPPPPLPETAEIQLRLDKDNKLLKEDQAAVAELTAQLAKAPESKKEALQVNLEQAQADLDLAQNELDDAKEDLGRAGGNLSDRIEKAKADHENTANANDTAIPTGPPPNESLGLVHRVQQWSALHRKQMQLWQAIHETEASGAFLAAQHNALAAKADVKKENLPELAHHSKKNTEGTRAEQKSPQDRTAEESAALLKNTHEIAEDQKTIADLDKRVEAHKELAAIYTKWTKLVAERQKEILHRMLMGVLIIVAIGLIGLFFSSWIDKLVQKISTDRRQMQSLHTVTRVTLQIAALLLILLVFFGPPGQLGTVLGLAGAGLTVALKDFIIGFLGWFVLMGKNGIRLGDWVEINGVSGEVVQIGPFHTVLLETGNWTDSGHPTSRRVTFTNSFAIEGHYFNFSTTGQWLWDELQVVFPSGQDPYPMIDAIRKNVEEVTKDTARQAEEEWRRATDSKEMRDFSAAPAITLKPAVGGIEVDVRYITRANERHAMRTKLYQQAVELLGGRAIPKVNAQEDPVALAKDKTVEKVEEKPPQKI